MLFGRGRRLDRLLRRSQRILVFTGAGVSVDSGIPDFRTPGGLWDRLDPQALSRWGFDRGPEGRAAYWHVLREIVTAIGDVQPNAVHRAVAALGRAGRVEAVVTQNVDGLHQLAGSDPARVVELHGDLRTCTCTVCGVRHPSAPFFARAAAAAPDCPACGGPLRPDVVVFGDALPTEAVRRAWAAARACDLCLVLGSSLAVRPASELPEVALRAGARLGIVNLTPTWLDDRAEVCLHAPLGEVFVKAVERVLEVRLR